MRQKINEIMDLLKGDPGEKPYQIIIDPINYDNDNCEYILHFKGKKPSQKVTKEEYERISNFYPDIPVLRIVWDDTEPKGEQ